MVDILLEEGQRELILRAPRSLLFRSYNSCDTWLLRTCERGCGACLQASRLQLVVLLCWLVLIIDLYNTFYKLTRALCSRPLCGHTHHFTSPLMISCHLTGWEVVAGASTSVAPTVWQGDSLWQEVEQCLIFLGGGGLGRGDSGSVINSLKDSTT